MTTDAHALSGTRVGERVGGPFDGVDAPLARRARTVPVFDRADDRTRHIRLSDGRQIALRLVSREALAAPDRNSAVLALHGTPGSRLKFAAAEPAALGLGLTLVSVDRWGYGDSDPHPRPSLAAFADDMASVLDALGLDRVAVVGVSGGGPYAVALATCRPDRVTALALVAPVGPLCEPDYAPRLRLAHRICFEVLPRFPGAATAVFELYRRLLAIAPSTAAGLISARASTRDRAIVLMPQVRERLAATFELGLRRGCVGAVTDLHLFAKPWGIDRTSVRAPCRIWLGTEDRNVPLEPITLLAEELGADLEILNGEGHYWIALEYARVLAWLADPRTNSATPASGET